MIKGTTTSYNPDNHAVDFLTWVRIEDFYFVKKQQKWFGPDGSLLTEEELHNRFLNQLNDSETTCGHC